MTITTIALAITGVFGRGPAVSSSSPTKDKGILKNGQTG